MSLFRWLEYKETNFELSGSFSQIHLEEESIESKINLNIESEDDIKSKKENSEYKELQEKYKQFFVVYNDENVVHHNGQELEE